MAKEHGRHTEISVGGDDISTYANTSELKQQSDSHDITMYGVDDYEYQGGLKKGTFTCGGVYDSAVGGPKAVITPLIGTVTEIIRKPIGTGTGKPTETFDALIDDYTETNPVAGMITWQMSTTRSGPIVPTVQA